MNEISKKGGILKIKNFFNSNKLIIIILFLAFLLRLIFCLVIFPPLVEQKGEELGWVIDGKLAADPYDSIAKNILAGKGYVDDSNRINFERLPLYIYFLVVVYKVWGFELWKLQIIQSILDTISCFLIFLISLKIFRDKTSALLAAFLYAIYFKIISTVAKPCTEPIYILLLLIFLYVFSLSFRKSKGIFPFFSGLLLGMMTLCKPITLLFPAVIIAIYFYKLKKFFLKKVLLFLVGFIILILPLFVRNYVLEGKVFFSTGGGKMLYMGTAFDYSKNFRSEGQRLIEEINDKYSFPYSIEEDNKLRRLAINNIVNDPWEYLKKLACRIYLFWTYPDYSTRMMALKTLLILIFNLTLIIFAIMGFYLSKKKRVFYHSFLWIILYFYFIYIVIYSYSRYSLPLFPILFMFSSYGIINLLRKFNPLALLRKNKL